MKIENVCVFGWESAFHGMRNPKESWERSDSKFYEESPFYLHRIARIVNEFQQKSGVIHDSAEYLAAPWPQEVTVPEIPFIGPKDMELACSLIKGGSEHRKFLRQIVIWADITIPRYCWQELDTYKVSTVRNSCSTMHKLGHRLLTQEDFEQPIEEQALKHLNELVILFRCTQDPTTDSRSGEIRQLRRKLKNDLPEGYLQMATYMMSYETALTILRQRHNHRLDEWSSKVPGSICSWILTLPYMKEFSEALLGDLSK